MEEPVYDKSKAELHNNKALYQLRKVDSLQDFNLFLYTVYYVLVLISIIVIFYKYDMNNYLKVVISFSLLFFPFIIRAFEDYVSDYYRYIMSLLYGVPHEKNNKK